MSVTPAHCRGWRVSLLLSLVQQVSKMMCVEIPLGILCREDKKERAGAEDYKEEILYSCALIPAPSYGKVAQFLLSLLKTECNPLLGLIMKNHQRTFTLVASNCCLRAWIRWPLKVSLNLNYSRIAAKSLIYDDQNHSWCCCLSSDDWENAERWTGNSPALSMEMIKFYFCCCYSGMDSPAFMAPHRHLQESPYLFSCRTSQKFKPNPSTNMYLNSAP